ncbi:MAG: NfeD family protein [Lachnospiraceae bacterium]|nr:NfeD family protein [Lachnospiraceae bacterium]
MEMIGWLIALVVFIGIEMGTMALTTIWFAGGALFAFLAALAGCSVQIQLVVFLAVSFVMLIFTRPFAAKFINRGTVKTNAESLIGRKARVTAEINDSLSCGAAVIGGQEWTARALNEDDVIPVGEIVVIREIRGVKLMVERLKEEKKL